jgi:hypothetical protein
MEHAVPELAAWMALGVYELWADGDRSRWAWLAQIWPWLRPAHRELLAAMARRVIPY